MNRKYISNIILGLLVIVVIGLIYFQQKRQNNYVPDFLVGNPMVDVITLKDKVSGKLVPSHKVEIKSSVSGIVDSFYVEVGDSVCEGMPIARIKPTPEPEELDNARQQLKTCEIQYELEKNDYERKLGLRSKGGMSDADIEQTQGNLEIAELELKAAQKKLSMLLVGYLDENSKDDNLILATSGGIVLELPVEKGQSIIKRTSSSDGTTIAVVADMKQLLFEGQLGEYEFNKVKPRMPLSLYVGAYNDLVCPGKVLRISPQSASGQDLVRFDFSASIDFPVDSLPAKAGLTVIAEYITAKTDSVLCVAEEFIHYSGDSIYVVKVDSGGRQIEQLVKLGLSDGVKAEVIEGLEISDRLKPNYWD